MFTTIRGATGAACLLLSAFAATSAHATNYNLLVFEDFTGQNSDVEGAVAAGGTITLSGYEIGRKLTAAHDGTNALVAGKAISFNNGSLDHGNAVSPAISGDFVTTTGSKTTGSPVDFAALKAQYTGYSAYDAGLAANGSVLNQSGTMALSGALAGLNVFSISGADLASTGLFTLDIPTSAAALINITGTSASFLNMDFDMGGTSASNILFNFADGTSLTLANVGFVGSILAPGADVNFSNGKLDGQLIAKSLSGAGPTGQINNVALNGGSFFPVGSSTPAPEPAAWTMLITGFGAIGAMLRRRKVSYRNLHAYYA